MDIAVLAIASVAIVLPVYRFIRSIWSPRSVVFYAHDGTELGEISSEAVQHKSLEDLERMHERVRREEHVRIVVA